MKFESHPKVKLMTRIPVRQLPKRLLQKRSSKPLEAPNKGADTDTFEVPIRRRKKENKRATCGI